MSGNNEGGVALTRLLPSPGREKCDEEMSSCNALALLAATTATTTTTKQFGYSRARTYRLSRDNDRPSRRDVIEVPLYVHAGSCQRRTGHARSQRP